MNRIKGFAVKNGVAVVAVVLYLVCCGLFLWAERVFGGAIDTGHLLLFLLPAAVLLLGDFRSVKKSTGNRVWAIAVAVLTVGCTALCLYRLYCNRYELLPYLYFATLAALGLSVLCRKKRPGGCERTFSRTALAAVCAALSSCLLLYVAAVGPVPVKIAEAMLAAEGYDTIKYIAVTEERSDRIRAGDAWEPLGTYFFTADRAGEERIVWVSVLSGAIVETDFAAG